MQDSKSNQNQINQTGINTNIPQSGSVNQPQPTAVQSSKEGADATEKTQSQSKQTTSNLQQPHLIKTRENKKVKIPLPNKSFLLAIVTIALTIALGILLATYLKKLTGKNGGEKTTTSENVTKTPESQMTKPQITQSPTATQLSTPSSSFEELIVPHEAETPTPSLPSATQEGTLIQ